LVALALVLVAAGLAVPGLAAAEPGVPAPDSGVAPTSVTPVEASPVKGPPMTWAALPTVTWPTVVPRSAKVGTVTGWGWCHKYRVAAVTEWDNIGGSPPMTLSYAYDVTASSTLVLWHHDRNYTANAAVRTWSAWRGYADLTIGPGPSGGPWQLRVDSGENQ